MAQTAADISIDLIPHPPPRVRHARGLAGRLRAFARHERAFAALRARPMAAAARAVLGLVGIALVVVRPGMPAHPAQVAAGFTVVLCSALVQLTLPKLSWMHVEETLGGAAAVLIIGLEAQHVTVLSLVWLAAITTGVMARGGMVHSVGRTLVIAALALPVIRAGGIGADYAGLCAATICLLMSSGRLTRELNHLLLQARHDADHDDLTGLLSRAAFRAALERRAASARAARPISLLLLDLDNFGKVNKTLGHAAGDALLSAAGGAIADAVDPGCLLGRLGGDEFAVIAPCADPHALAQRILDALHDCAGEGQRVSACIGAAQAPRDGHGADALLMAGDIALRVAKRSRRGAQISSYVGESLSGAGERSARYLLTRLIAGEGIRIAVQPIVDLRTGAVHAYEALTRLEGTSLQDPLHWLSVADELGERDALERACLRAALQLPRRRPDGARLSVNLSAPVLLDPRTLQILIERGDLSDLIIEVTEEALVASDSQLHAAIAPLLERGASLAVDDMGAGYSGLRQVTAVRPQYLKLDRSLIQGIDVDPARGALVAALVGYAERVGGNLVAEGVETAAELRALRAVGVPLAQGYYFARPGDPWPQVAAGSLPEADAGGVAVSMAAWDRRPRQPALPAALGAAQAQASAPLSASARS